MQDNLTRVKNHLNDYPLSSSKEIARALDISPSTVSKWLRVLQGHGVLRSQARWFGQHSYTMEYWLDENHRKDA